MDDSRSASPPLSDGAADAAARVRILVVDDDALISICTADMLDDLGYEAIEANSGEQALELLRGDIVIDALLTDFSMPGMSGVELAEAAIALRPGLPVLLATGFAELPTGGAFKLPTLSKPYRQSQLSDAISTLLDGDNARNARLGITPGT